MDHKKINYTIPAIFLFLCLSAMAQGQSFDVKDHAPLDIIPPSPNALSLSKGAGINVGLYTGAATVNVPIHTVKSRKLSHNISLSYRNSGIKVEEIAPWAGLGWTLNAGGAITRTIRGLPDDHANGFPNIAPIPPGTTADYDYYFELYSGDRDGQPDLFSINAGGLSARFILTKSGEPLLIPEQRLKVEYERVGQEIREWTITGTDGTIYRFDQIEETETHNLGGRGDITQDPVSISSWYLSSIESAQGDDMITFHYTDYRIIYDVNGSDTQGNGSISDSNNRLTIDGKRLSSIGFVNGSVEFTQSEIERCDLRGDHPLKEIEVRDGEGNRIKKFALGHRYLTGNGTTEFTEVPGTNSDTGKRLILSSVTESGTTGTEANPPYLFEYESSQYLPDRFSNAQDHWGFYNGVTGNSTLIPAQKVRYQFLEIVQLRDHRGADREVREAYAKAGSLREVTYPTGGSTVFELESNDCESNLLANDIEAKTVQLGIGNNTQATIEVATIAEPFAKVTAHSFVTFNDPNCICYIDFTSGGGESQTLQFTSSGFLPKSVNLETGTYQVSTRLNTGCTSQGYDDGGIFVGWENELPTTHKKAGGLRVSRTVDLVDGEPAIITGYGYELDGLSSGRLSNAPFYGYFLFNDFDTPVFFRTSFSNIPLGHTQGAPVGYAKVTQARESTVEGEDAGMTEHFYVTTADFPDANPYQISDQDGHQVPAGELYGSQAFSSSVGHPLLYPFAPIGDKDHLRGLLTDQKDYRYAGTAGAYELVRHVHNEYNYYDYYDFAPDGGYQVNGAVAGPRGVPFEFPALTVSPFTLSTGRAELASSSETLYFNGAAHTTSVHNTYDPFHFQLKETTRELSGGEREKVVFRYVEDYDTAGAAGTGPVYNALKILKRQHAIYTPIETVRYRDTGDGVFVLTGGILHTYNEFSPGKVYPKGVFSTRLAAPLANHALSSVDGNTFTYNNDIYEEGVTFTSYDSFGNLTGMLGRDGVPVSYIWGHNRSYPVAEVVNATPNVLENAGLPVGGITGGLSTAQENLLRQSPLLSGALATTYRYRPIVGLLSSTGPNGQTVHYEYDALNRLQKVRDRDNHIVRQHGYNYKN